MFHPSPYLRRASEKAGEIKKVAPVFLSGNRAVTALIDSENNLKLISWDLVGLNTIVRKHSISAGVVKDIAIERNGFSQVLLAIRTQSGNLKLIAYQVSASGSFSRVASYTAGAISALAMVKSREQYITAVRDADGKLKLTAWRLQTDVNGTKIIRLGSANAGSISALSLTYAHHFKGVYTAVRDSDGNLLVIPWKISTDGCSIVRGESGSAGKTDKQISVAPLQKGVGVALRDSEGAFRFISWEVSSNGNIIRRRETLAAGKVSEITLLKTPHSNSNLTAVVRDGQGSLRLISLLMSKNGTNLRRAGVSVAGAANKIAATAFSRSFPGQEPRDFILTAMRDSHGELKLISWDANMRDVDLPNSIQSSRLHEEFLSESTTLALPETIELEPEQIEIFPNPSRSRAQIVIDQAGGKRANILLYNTNGLLIREFLQNFNLESGKNRIPITTGGLPAGIYFCKIIIDGKAYTKRLVVAN